jgi:membrane protein DedA with SNARE-associated domain
MDPVVFAQQLVVDYGLLGVFLASIILNASIILPLPADALVFAAGAASASTVLFNPLAVGVFAGLGSTIGEMTSYLAGLGMHLAAINKKHIKGFKQVQDLFDKYGFWGIAFVTFTPLPTDVAGLIAGSVHYNPTKFFLAVLAGKLPRCIIVAYAGQMGMAAVLSFFQGIF